MEDNKLEYVCSGLRGCTWDADEMRSTKVPRTSYHLPAQSIDGSLRSSSMQYRMPCYNWDSDKMRMPIRTLYLPASHITPAA